MIGNSKLICSIIVLTACGTRDEHFRLQQTAEEARFDVLDSELTNRVPRIPIKVSGFFFDRSKSEISGPCLLEKVTQDATFEDKWFYNRGTLFDVGGLGNDYTWVRRFHKGPYWLSWEGSDDDALKLRLEMEGDSSKAALFSCKKAVTLRQVLDFYDKIERRGLYLDYGRLDQSVEYNVEITRLGFPRKAPPNFFADHDYLSEPDIFAKVILPDGSELKTVTIQDVSNATTDYGGRGAIRIVTLDEPTSFSLSSRSETFSVTIYDEDVSYNDEICSASTNIDNLVQLGFSDSFRMNILDNTNGYLGSGYYCRAYLKVTPVRMRN